jgi:hypothetical protein
MKKIMLASVALVAFASPSFAQGFSFGGGTNFNNVLTNAGTLSVGNAAAGSLAAGQQTSIGSGFATTTPAGSLTAGVGASAGQAQSVSGAASIGNGAAVTAGSARTFGFGAGVGLALQ